MSEKKIYLDVCVLSRPFDDQEQARIRLETDALELILAYVRKNERVCVVSPMHLVEIKAIINIDERQHLLLLLEEVGIREYFDLSGVREQAEIFNDRGMGVADAAHVAFAIAAQSDFISVDDRLLKQCIRFGIEIWSGSPLAYCDKEDLR